jgi:hypothetical protein
VRAEFAARSGLSDDWLDNLSFGDWVELEHFRT